MGFEFMQLADPQFGMFAAISRRSGKRRRALWDRFRAAGLLGDDDPSVPEHVDGLRPECARLDAAVAEANRRRPAFVAVCGDLVNNVDDPEQSAAFFRSIAALDPAIPVRWVPGNHDLSVDFQRPTSDGLSAYRDGFGEDYYAFEHGEALFLALNSETLLSAQHVPGEDERQIDFVTDVLASRRAREARQIVAFTHRPLVWRAADGRPVSGRAGDRRRELHALLSAHGVSAVFAGHLHQNRYLELDGVEQVVSGAVGFPLVGDSGYRMVRIEGERIDHTFHPFAGLASALD